MIKIICGQRYNTDNAVLVGSRETDDYKADLYTTPRRKYYFLHGTGNVLSVFRGKEKIIALTDEEKDKIIELFS